MLFQRIYDPLLAQASYLVGCQATGEAAVIDPNRDIEQYLTAARAERMKITHVTETHIHADFLSGARELAQRAGATLLLSAEGGADWSYGFAKEAGATLLKNGDSFAVGNIRFDVLHTPGHTPEHLCFLVTDTPATDAPLGILSGDCVFVGDVGRPDLLEKAAGHAGTMADSARARFRTLQTVKRLPDHLQIWPGHGAGSACGKALGAVPSSTLGYEKIANWALGSSDEAEFVRAVLAGQPEPPKYFATMKRLNRDGPPAVPRTAAPRIEPSRLKDLLKSGAVVVDTRTAAAFAAGHLRGTISIPLNRALPGYAGWVLPYDTDIWLLTDPARPSAADEAAHHLRLIGLDRIAGWLPLDDSLLAGGAEMVTQISPAELAKRLDAGTVSVVDVRGRSEWEAGRIPGAPNIHYGEILARLDELPPGPLVLQCQTGARSNLAASLLLGRGRTDVINLTGGLSAWIGAGLAVEEPQSVAGRPA